MKLSQAILLGDTLKKCDPETWISDDGSCGCALGGALLATGCTAEEFSRQWVANRVNEMPCIKSRWPWLTWENLVDISNLYRKVAKGFLKIEDVAAFVAEIEPEEEPEEIWGEPSSDTSTGQELDSVMSQGWPK